jgi:hypothetical protein
MTNPSQNPRRSALRLHTARPVDRVFAVIGAAAVALLLSNQALARTTTICREHWFEGDDSKPVRTTPCQKSRSQWRGGYYEVLDGKAYFVVYISESQSFSPLLGRRFSQHVITQSTNRWLLEAPVDIAALRAWKKDGVLAPRYASDGRSVFRGWKRIDGADPASFQTLNQNLAPQTAADDADDSKWSRDARSLYLDAQRIENANPDDLHFIDERSFSSDGREFVVTLFDGVKQRQCSDTLATPAP